MPATNVPLELNKTFTFNTLAPSILGAQMKNAKLLGMMDYSTAITYDNIDLKFRQIYPVLPPNSPDQPESCIYYRFLSESGVKIVLADAWIDLTTVEVVEHINFQITLNDCSMADKDRIRDALNALGYQNFVIKQI